MQNHEEVYSFTTDSMVYLFSQFIYLCIVCTIEYSMCLYTTIVALVTKRQKRYVYLLLHVTRKDLDTILFYLQKLALSHLQELSLSHTGKNYLIAFVEPGLSLKDKKKKKKNLHPKSQNPNQSDSFFREVHFVHSAGMDSIFFFFFFFHFN